jgi:hypothetical protein
MCPFMRGRACRFIHRRTVRAESEISFNIRQAIIEQHVKNKRITHRRHATPAMCMSERKTTPTLLSICAGDQHKQKQGSQAVPYRHGWPIAPAVG